MKIEVKLILILIGVIFLSGTIGYFGALYIVNAAIPLVFFLCIVLAASLSKFFSNYIVKQLGTLQNTIIDIAQGNLNKRVLVRTKDEIGELSLKFNEMITRLQEAHESLEKKVRERTGEITVLKTSLETRVKERTAELEALKATLEKTVAERTRQLNEKIEVLEKLNHMMVGRELRMIELKKEIEKLKNNTN